MSIPIRTRSASLATAFAVGLLASAALAAPAAAEVKLGVFNSGAPKNAKTVAEYTELVGRQPAIVMWYHDFGHDILTSEEIATLEDTGQAPMVTWEPFKQSLSSIASGQYDSYLRESAQTARDYGGELMIRFAHEMNGSWYPWSRSSSYVDAWRHIVSVFRDESADNVRWVWAPNIDRNGQMPFAEYFPGEGWVDYIGLDGYNWGGKRWASFESVFSSSYEKITKLSSKPLLVTETSSSENGGDKAAWIRTAFMKTIPERFPRMIGVIWFNKKQEDNWPITSSQESLQAYRDVVACSIYGGSGPCDPGAVETTGEAAVAQAEDALTIEEVRVTPRVLPPSPHPRTAASSARRRRAARLRAIRRRALRRRAAIVYRLNRRARRVRIAIQHRSRHGFVRQAVAVRRGHPGRNRVALRSVLGRHTLHRGRYRVVIVASDGRGSRSRPHLAHFRVVR